MKTFYVYILANKRRGVLYIGVTSNLQRRIYLHKKGKVPGFTKKYGIHKLVHFEECDDALNTIHREKCIKKWNRQWKIELIERLNPGWRDLYYTIM